MARPTRIHRGKQPYRLHYIPEWAKKRGVRQAEIARELGVDKSTVSRWFEGALPVEAHFIALTAFFYAEEPAALFRHPDDDWMRVVLRGKTDDERERIKAMIEAAFPRKGAAA